MSKKYPVPWYFYAVSGPILLVSTLYMYIEEKVLARGWVYLSDEPGLYWFGILVYTTGGCIALYRLYLSIKSRENL